MLTVRQLLSVCWQKFRHLCAFLGKKTPVVNSLLWFSGDVHRQAGIKFAALWFLSSLPVLVAILLSQIPEGTASLGAKLGSKLRESITVTEAFVYAAAFISPVLYLVIQRYVSLGFRRKKSFAAQIKTDLSGLFPGYVFVWILALLVLIGTAVAFAAQKADPIGFKQTFLSEIGDLLAPSLYFFSLICWYLTLCDEFIEDFDYPDASRTAEDDLAQDFAKRIHERGANE